MYIYIYTDESPLMKRFRTSLPPELNRYIAHLSCDTSIEAKSIFKHLQSLYGDRADPERQLDRIKQSHGTQTASTAPILEYDDVIKMLDEESYYEQQAKRAMDIAVGTAKNNYANELQHLLGIHPDSPKENLNPQLINRSEMSAEEAKRYREKYEDNPDTVDVITGLLLNRFTVLYKEYRVIESAVVQPRCKYYYRGENAVYPSSIASIWRGDTSGLNLALRLFRLDACCSALDKFDAVINWDYSRVNYIALAQHYGCLTPALDITSDLKVALFFACCKFDAKNGWLPLCEHDFQRKDSRWNIAKHGGDSRYGLLFRAPGELTDLELAIEDDNPGDFGMILPVGYQPFSRCAAQSAYMIMTQDHTSSCHDLQKDARFEMFRVRLTKHLCEWIYDEMQQGKLVYPVEDIPDISSEVQKFNSICDFTRQTISTFNPNARLFSEDQWIAWENQLAQMGIKVYPILPPVMDKKIVDEVNRIYPASVAMRKTGVIPKFRPIARIDGTVHDVDPTTQTEHFTAIPLNQNRL